MFSFSATKFSAITSVWDDSLTLHMMLLKQITYSSAWQRSHKIFTWYLEAFSTILRLVPTSTDTGNYFGVGFSISTNVVSVRSI